MGGVGSCRRGIVFYSILVIVFRGIREKKGEFYKIYMNKFFIKRDRVILSFRNGGIVLIFFNFRKIVFRNFFVLLVCVFSIYVYISWGLGRVSFCG